MSNYHEPPEELTPEDRNLVRALVSLKEEIEAIDWYQQRLSASRDDQLKAILKHNQREEMEHACMAIEWLRRNMPGWDDALRTYLFTEGEIAAIEKAADESGDSADLGVRSLKE